MRPAVLYDLADVGAARLHLIARDLARHPMTDSPPPTQDAFCGPPEIARDQGICLFRSPGMPDVSRHFLALARSEPAVP